MRRSPRTSGVGPRGTKGHRARRESPGRRHPRGATLGQKRNATADASDALWRTDAPRVAPRVGPEPHTGRRRTTPWPVAPPYECTLGRCGRCRHDRVLDIPPRGQAAKRRQHDRARRSGGRKDPDARPRGTPACPRGAWPARRSGGAWRVDLRAPAIARCADGGTLPPGGVDL